MPASMRTSPASACAAGVGGRPSPGARRAAPAVRRLGRSRHADTQTHHGSRAHAQPGLSDRFIAAPPRRVHLDASQRGLQQSGQVLEPGLEQLTANQQHVGQADLADVEAARRQRVVLVEAGQRLGLEHAHGGERAARGRPARSAARCARGRARRPARPAGGRRVPSRWRAAPVPSRTTGSENVSAAEHDVVAAFALIAQAHAVVGLRQRLGHRHVGVGVADGGLERAQLRPLLHRPRQRVRSGAAARARLPCTAIGPSRRSSARRPPSAAACSASPASRWARARASAERARFTSSTARSPARKRRSAASKIALARSTEAPSGAGPARPHRRA